MINSFYKKIIDSLDSYIVVIHKDGRVVYANKLWEKLLYQFNGDQKHDYFWQQSQNINAHADISVPLLQKKVEQLFANQNDSFVVEAPQSIADNTLWFKIDGSVIDDADERYVLLNFNNVIDKKLDQKTIADLMLIDPLTGLATPNYFKQFFTSEWQRSIRSHTALALFIVECEYQQLDKAAIASIANVFLQQARRPSDCAGILTTHKFALVLGNLNSTDCQFIAAKLEQQISALNICTQAGKPINIHIGASSTIPSLIDSSNVLFKASCCALRKAIEAQQSIHYEQPSICLQKFRLPIDKSL